MDEGLETIRRLNRHISQLVVVSFMTLAATWALLVVELLKR